MEKSHETSQTHCLNCGAVVSGEFCHECGQRVRDNVDRSLVRLIGEFFGNIFFLDNRFFLTLKYLIAYPGRMTVEFLDGKRKKFISPVTLFLFINLVYFFVNPLSDYSLALYDQMHSQPYSTWVKGWVDDKMKEEGLNEKDYAITYQNMSDDISKSIIIINAPMIAAFLFLMTFKKRPFYFDSLIYAFHFFTVLLFSWVMLDWVARLFILITGHDSSIFASIISKLFLLVIPLLYAILSIKKFMRIRWYWSIPAGFGVVVATILASLFYRFTIFVATFWAT